MEEFTKNIKNLFREKINIVIILLLIVLGLNIYGHIKLRKKIDHRYYNITKSIEDIHQVEINTYNGELKPAKH